MSYIFNSVEEYNSAMMVSGSEMNPEYSGKDVYLYISNKEYNNASLNLVNMQHVINPCKLHLSLKSCVFTGATISGKQVYVTNLQEAYIYNCIFQENEVSDYGFDINHVTIKNAEIVFEKCSFIHTGLKAAVKAAARLGYTDHPSDFSVTEPGTIKSVSFINCNFRNNVVDFNCGTTPKGGDHNANQTTGEYQLVLKNNSSIIRVAEPYIVNLDETAPISAVSAGFTVIKSSNSSLTKIMSEIGDTSRELLNAINNIKETSINNVGQYPISKTSNVFYNNGSNIDQSLDN